MYYIIYQITNLINKKIYIGKHETNCIEDGYMGSGKLLKRAIAKYGIDNFKKEILFVFASKYEMDAKEREIVTEDFVSKSDNYNLCPGGHGGFGYINRNNLNIYENHGKLSGQRAIETRKKRMAEDPSYKDMIDAHNTRALQKAVEALKIKYPHGTWAGRSHKEETLLKFKGHTRQVGSKNSQFGSMWITDGTLNKKISKTSDIPSGWSKGRTSNKP